MSTVRITLWHIVTGVYMHRNSIATSDTSLCQQTTTVRDVADVTGGQGQRGARVAHDHGVRDMDVPGRLDPDIGVGEFQRTRVERQGQRRGVAVYIAQDRVAAIADEHVLRVEQQQPAPGSVQLHRQADGGQQQPPAGQPPRAGQLHPAENVQQLSAGEHCDKTTRMDGEKRCRFRWAKLEAAAHAS